MKKKEIITSRTCRSCGACCISPTDQEVFADVTKEDMEKMGRRLVRLHVLQPTFYDQFVGILNRSYTPPAIKTKTSKMKSGLLRGWTVTRCNALDGVPMKKVSCRIYKVRPDVCKNAVKPGDKVCRQIRRQLFDIVEADDE